MYEDMQEDYFNWMCNLVCDRKRHDGKRYVKLLWHLHMTEFIYIMEMDDNRAEDGMDLRHKFGDEYCIDEELIIDNLYDKPCSVLEMMIALSIRCEDNIMGDPDIGNRTEEWFWNMIDNLGLSKMHDALFLEEYVDLVLHRFLYREYQPDGKGGLFHIPSTHIDLRNIDIWYQMCRYLNTVLSERRN